MSSTLDSKPVIYHRSKPAVPAKSPAVGLDPTDRSPPGYAVSRPTSRHLRDALSVVRERMMSPVLKFQHPDLKAMGLDLVCREWTISLQRQRSYCARILGGLEGKTVLVLGCGFGDDASAWRALRPGRIVGVDVVNYSACWNKCSGEGNQYDTVLEFLQYDLTSPWKFVAPGSVDVISSYAVLEHISDLESLMAASAKALRPGGLFVATYGPLWFGPNGDHTFPRSEEDYYNHLLLDDSDYAEYIERTRAEWKHQGNALEGPFLLERALFSYLRIDEYLSIYRSAGFEVLLSLANLSDAARRYRLRHAEVWSRLKKIHALRDVDLLCNGSTVILRKPTHLGS